jgi:hypothetical protein
LGKRLVTILIITKNGFSPEWLRECSLSSFLRKNSLWHPSKPFKIFDFQVNTLYMTFQRTLFWKQSYCVLYPIFIQVWSLILIYFYSLFFAEIVLNSNFNYDEFDSLAAGILQCPIFYPKDQLIFSMEEWVR